MRRPGTPAVDTVPRRPADLYARGLSGAASRLLLRHEDGTTRPVPLATWIGAVTPVDRRVIERLHGPVLDVGCGPGRHVAALQRRGVTALGIDVSPAAVLVARNRGAAAVRGDVFGRVPAAGRWGEVLLLDGNVGIGGRPARLLRRCATLLRTHGRVVVELSPPGTPTVRVRVRLEHGRETSAWFPWAHVAADDIDVVARSAGLRVTDRFEEGSRWFCGLVAA